MLVVATTLVSEARSKMLAVVVSGVSVSYKKWPKALRQSTFPWCVTATEAAGNARALMALRRRSKAAAKTASCWSYAGTGKSRDAAVFGEELSGKNVVCPMFGL